MVAKPEGKRPLVRPGRRWEDLLRRIFERVDGDMDWIDVAQDRERRPVICERGNEPSGYMKCGKFLDYQITG